MATSRKLDLLIKLDFYKRKEKWHLHRDDANKEEVFGEIDADETDDHSQHNNAFIAEDCEGYYGEVQGVEMSQSEPAQSQFSQPAFQYDVCYDQAVAHEAIQFNQPPFEQTALYDGWQMNVEDYKMEELDYTQFVSGAHYTSHSSEADLSNLTEGLFTGVDKLKEGGAVRLSGLQLQTAIEEYTIAMRILIAEYQSRIASSNTYHHGESFIPSEQDTQGVDIMVSGSHKSHPPPEMFVASCCTPPPIPQPFRCETPCPRGRGLGRGRGTSETPKVVGISFGRPYRV